MREGPIEGAAASDDDDVVRGGPISIAARIGGWGNNHGVEGAARARAREARRGSAFALS